MLTALDLVMVPVQDVISFEHGGSPQFRRGAVKLTFGLHIDVHLSVPRVGSRANPLRQRVIHRAPLYPLLLAVRFKIEIGKS